MDFVNGPFTSASSITYVTFVAPASPPMAYHVSQSASPVGCNPRAACAAASAWDALLPSLPSISPGEKFCRSRSTSNAYGSPQGRAVGALGLACDAALHCAEAQMSVALTSTAARID